MYVSRTKLLTAMVSGSTKSVLSWYFWIGADMSNNLQFIFLSGKVNYYKLDDFSVQNLRIFPRGSEKA